MKRFAIATLVAVALLAGCADDDQLDTAMVPEAVVEAENTANAQPALSPEQELMKQNLDAAAQLLVTALNKPAVQRELQQLDYEKIRTDRLSFEQLLRNPAKDGSFRCLATELGRSLNAGAKSGNNLADYLIEQGCELYLPYPLDWYPADAPITVAGHPIDNVVEGPGHVWDAATGTLRTVLVNDEYADKNPVAIIQMISREGRNPEDGRDPGGREIRIREDFIDDGGGTWGGGGSGSGSSSNTCTATITNREHPQDVNGQRFLVKMGEVWCRQKTNIFEGDLELRIEFTPLSSLAGAALAGHYIPAVGVDIPKAYVKAAYNGWAHSNGGWYPANCDLITNWVSEIVAFGLLAYEYDPEKAWSGSIGFGVTVKGTGGNISFSKAANEYKGDLFGKVIWGRTDFIDRNTNPPSIEEMRGEWMVWSIGANLKITVKWAWY